MNPSMRFSSAAMGMVMLAGLAYYQGRMDQALGEEDKLVGTALAATDDREPVKGNFPTRALPERDAYLPGTEALAADEMRIVACRTGMPNASSKQAATCFLVELQ
jgi:hypothetical protein